MALARDDRNIQELDQIHILNPENFDDLLPSRTSVKSVSQVCIGERGYTTTKS